MGNSSNTRPPPSGGDAMVVLEVVIAHVGEHMVGVPVASVDAAALVVKFHKLTSANRTLLS